MRTLANAICYAIFSVVLASSRLQLITNSRPGFRFPGALNIPQRLIISCPPVMRCRRPDESKTQPDQVVWKTTAWQREGRSQKTSQACRRNKQNWQYKGTWHIQHIELSIKGISQTRNSSNQSFVYEYASCFKAKQETLNILGENGDYLTLNWFILQNWKPRIYYFHTKHFK